MYVYETSASILSDIKWIMYVDNYSTIIKVIYVSEVWLPLVSSTAVTLDIKCSW